MSIPVNSIVKPRTSRQGSRALNALPLPEAYRKMSAEELDGRITDAKARLKESTLILGHHYQRDEIIKFADVRGDSFKLARWAADNAHADHIVFCGVHFMAESADILTGPHQKVILPNLEAGCSMADMANIDDVETCWEELSEAGVDGVIPITYINSAASLKAFVGRNGGIVCTSSNARKVLQWAFDHGKRLLFFPDQHLGRNTAYGMGIPLEKMIVWDPAEYMGGHDAQTLRDSKVFLWKGHCSVHGRFTVEQAKELRNMFPGIKVLVHPECTFDLVQEADLNGSTEFIIKQVSEAPPGSQWAIGTEINLVHRLADTYPDQMIICLDPIVCPCSTMYRIHPAYLAFVLDQLLEGQVVNQIVVDEDVAHWARVALDRMLQVA